MLIPPRTCDEDRGPGDGELRKEPPGGRAARSHVSFSLKEFQPFP